MIPFPNGEEFQATGLMVLERNWLDVYSKWEKWTGNKVASFQIGDTFTPRRMEMTAGAAL
jgi:DNA topoisomerase III